MRIWSFVQQKGGSGKSTIATNLAVHAEENGETVLIVDLDPQSSATLWHSERGTNKPNVLDAIPDKLTNIVQSADNARDHTLPDRLPVQAGRDRPGGDPGCRHDHLSDASGPVQPREPAGHGSAARRPPTSSAPRSA